MSVECKGQNCCIVGCKSYFHKINATTPISGFIKHKDCTDYCRELHDYAGKAYGIGSPPYHLSYGKGNKTDRAAVLQSLDIVAKTMHNDLTRAKKNKDYITDENAKRLKQAAKSLHEAGLTGYHLEREIDELAWFVGGDPAKILQLQHKLNQLSIPGKSGRLKEDGVYGRETLSAWNSFIDKLGNGVTPTLAWTNPLQTNLTGIQTAFKTTKSGVEFSQIVSNNYPKIALFKADMHRYGNVNNYYHINIEALPNAPKFQQTLAGKLNHFEISEDAYHMLKRFENIAKPVRCAGKILLVAGAALDVLEIGTAIANDVKNPNQKFYPKTISTVASIGGRWGGTIAGTKLGAMGGAAIGTMILPGLGTAIGGAVGGLVLGVAGTFAGEAFAEWVIDITEVGE